MNKVEFTVNEGQAGKRLDVFVAEALDSVSRTHVQKLIEAEAVNVGGKTVKANYKVQANDTVVVTIPEAIPVEVLPEDIPLDILYEDQDVIVVNKPRGMVVHPAVGNYTGTLVNALLEHCKDLSGINGSIRPGIVHRLDKDTSGVMIAVKNDQAHLSLAEQIKNRTASRRYTAIVHGNIEESQGIINAPIGRHPIDRKKMAVTFENSKEAITKFKVLERFGNYTLVECKLMTGRTHQIRVHMAHIGHPVVGDPKYGSGRKLFAIEGQALHSTELTFIHPSTGKQLSFRAEIPKDMQEILKKLRNK